MVITRIFNCEFYLTRPQSSLLRNERSARGDGKEEKGRQTTGTSQEFYLRLDCLWFQRRSFAPDHQFNKTMVSLRAK